ncbi:phosphoribosylformylglycinamidine cyclo-ligase [Brassica rapa]|uniref:phosphoribosylformylglycinamidine cyclo-ligase n=1 Tax=Brassica campestris TaxID=3711 RepID=UPI00142DD2E1|nr:phosphoribosylformylglycinamidine cyclo-ligase [Brassica rapa]
MQNLLIYLLYDSLYFLIYFYISLNMIRCIVNDIVTSGAKPLFFLDYFATSRLHVDLAEKVIKGGQSDCALLGGETAEMPDFYAGGEYDLSGFAVGIVKKDSVMNGKNIVDILVGILVEKSSSQVVSITVYKEECLADDLATTQARVQGVRDDRRGTSRKARWSVGNTKIFGRSLMIYGEKEIGPNQACFLLPCYQNDVG